MTLYVLDASVAAVWVLPDEADAQAEEALQRMEESGAVVPALWHLEVCNVLTVAERRGRIAAEHTQRAVRALNRLPILTDPTPNLDLAFHLARAHGLTFYDGLYLELAVRHRTALATLDHRLSRAAAAEGLPAV